MGILVVRMAASVDPAGHIAAVAAAIAVVVAWYSFGAAYPRSF